jgi:hypothetical protein
LGVEKLRIKGYYAKPWPAYFRDKFGVRVVGGGGGRLRLSKGDDGWVRKLNKGTLEDFRRYQNGTDLLDLWEEEAGDSEFL